MARYGDVILKYRKELKMTQADLAQLLFISPQAVSKWEKNQSEPDIDTIKKLAEIFDVSLDTFLKHDVKEDILANDIHLFSCSTCGKSYQVEAIHQVKPFVRCKACHKKISEEDAYIKEQLVYRGKKEEKKRLYQINPFFMGGLIGFITYVIVLNSSSSLEPKGSQYASALIMGMFVVAFSTQMFYPSRLKAFIGHFSGHLFNTPGVIFELSIEGLISFIFTRLILGSIVLLISLGLLLVGLIIGFMISPVTYVYELYEKIRGEQDEL